MPGHGHPDDVNTSTREPRSAFRCMAHPTLDFLRLVLVCHCHAPRASRLGGWSPASTLCVTPLPRPAEWVAVRPLERRLFSLSGSPISCIEGLQVCRTCLCSGVDRARASARGYPKLPGPPSCDLSASHEHVSSDAHHSPFLNSL